MSAAVSSTRSEEDKIIEVMVIEGLDKQYEDADFVPSRSSLYENIEVIPYYDEKISSQVIWKRPGEMSVHAEYFSGDERFPLTMQGT